MPCDLAGTVCTEFIKVISRLLDEALDYQQQPPSSSAALSIMPNPHDTENMNLNTTNTTTTTMPVELPEEADIPASQQQQQQIQGLMLDGGPMESLWFGMGMEYGVGDDAFHGLGRGLVSDGMNWLDELGLNADLDDGGIGS